MKATQFLAIVFMVFSALATLSQDEQPLIITIDIHNELTGQLVDAQLSYTGSGLTRVEKGKYRVVVGVGNEEVLTISKDGYFDTEVRLDYETEKATSIKEVVLQPGIPQLYITILDDKTEDVIPSAIDLFTLDESSIIFSEQVEVAPYTIDVEYNRAHVLQVRAPGYFSFKDTVDFTNVFDGRVRERTIRLVPLKAGNKISLNNIYFEENKADLTEFAKIMLVELTHVLEQQRGLVIEVGAYTDDVGSDDYNLLLSEKRAIAVKEYLLEKGADEKQLFVKGYGEAFPITANDTPENRALNRRVEFKILSVN